MDNPIYSQQYYDYDVNGEPIKPSLEDNFIDLSEFFGPLMHKNTQVSDYKSQLSQYLQRNKMTPKHISVPDPNNPRGNPYFKCKLHIFDRTFQTDIEYSSKKEAEKAVALKALEFLDSPENDKYARFGNVNAFISSKPVNKQTPKIPINSSDPVKKITSNTTTTTTTIYPPSSSSSPFFHPSSSSSSSSSSYPETKPTTKSEIFEIIRRCGYELPNIKINENNNCYTASCLWCNKYFEFTTKTKNSAEQKVAESIYEHFKEINKSQCQYQYQALAQQIYQPPTQQQNYQPPFQPPHIEQKFQPPTQQQQYPPPTRIHHQQPLNQTSFPSSSSSSIQSTFIQSQNDLNSISSMNQSSSIQSIPSTSICSQSSNLINSTSLNSQSIQSVESSQLITSTTSTTTTSTTTNVNENDKCYLYDLLVSYYKENNRMMPEIRMTCKKGLYQYIAYQKESEMLKSELCLNENTANDDIALKIIDHNSLWENIMMNKFNKVAEYIITKFYDKVSTEYDGKIIKIGNIIFYNTDPLDNIEQFYSYMNNINEICRKCVDILRRGDIVPETPTPTPTPTSSSISTPINEMEIKNEIIPFKDEPKVMQMSDILYFETKSGKEEIVKYKLDYSYYKFNSNGEYYLYTLTCISSTNTTVYKNCYGIISQSKEDINYNFAFVYNNENYNGNWSYCKSIQLSRSDISCLQEYTKNILNCYYGNKCKYDYSIGKQYYLCKMNKEKNILFYEMGFFKNAFDQLKDKKSTPVLYRNENDKLLYHIRNGEDCRNWIISHESLDFSDPDSEYLYKVVEVTNMSPYYRINSSEFSNDISYSELYYSKYSVVSQEDQNLVKCILLRSNNIKSDSYISSDNYTYFLPEFCTVCYGNCDEFKFISFLPSVCYEYEYATRFCQFKKKLLQTETEYVSDDVSMIVNCLTPYLYNEDYNYEKYFNFGNILTKFFISLSLYYQYSFESSSVLSSKRSEMFTKKNIKETAENLKLYEVIRSLNMPGSWIPLFSNCEEVTEIPESSLKSALLAIIYFIYYGITRSFDICNEFLIHSKETVLINEMKQCLYNDMDNVIPVYNMNNNSNKEKWICDVENIIQYSFKDTELLIRAFTLKSSSSIETNNYETLEFIGDSFLDFIVLEKIETEYSDFVLSQLLEVKSYLTNNDTLAYISASIGINQFIRNSKSKIDDNIREFIARLIDENINYGNGYEFLEISPLCPSKKPSRNYNHSKWGTGVDTPKVLADIFESLIGAVLIDGGYYNAQKVVNRIYDQLLKIITPRNIPKHPVTELSHYLSSNNLPAAVFESEELDDRTKVSVKVNNECIGYAISKFKNNAVIKAAENALVILKNKKY